MCSRRDLHPGLHSDRSLASAQSSRTPSRDGLCHQNRKSTDPRSTCRRSCRSHHVREIRACRCAGPLGSPFHILLHHGPGRCSLGAPDRGTFGDPLICRVRQGVSSAARADPHRGEDQGLAAATSSQRTTWQSRQIARGPFPCPPQRLDVERDGTRGKFTRWNGCSLAEQREQCSPVLIAHRYITIRQDRVGMRHPVLRIRSAYSDLPLHSKPKDR
jgi:hypothetical protein